MVMQIKLLVLLLLYHIKLIDWKKRSYFHSSFSHTSMRMTSVIAKLCIEYVPSHSRWEFAPKILGTSHRRQAVHPFDLIRSKILASPAYPFDCIRSKFSSAMFPFDCIHANIFFIPASVHPICFERLGYPFLIRVRAVRSLGVRSFLRNAFAWGVSYIYRFVLTIIFSEDKLTW